MDPHGNRPDERDTSPVPFVFPTWANQIPRLIPAALAVVGAIVVLGVWFWFSPKHTEVGYQPIQPVAYSHKLHAGDLGIDCRYCHVAVDKGPAATVPPTETCMNCHGIVKYDSPKLELVRESFKTGAAIPWVKVHDLPDFSYFSHAQHVVKGVGCVSCHGRIDQQEIVRVSEPMSMSWCLDCHRNPGPNLRPADQVTNMNWEPPAEPAAREQLAAELVQKYHVAPPVDCSGCHR